MSISSFIRLFLTNFASNFIETQAILESYRKLKAKRSNEGRLLRNCLIILLANKDKLPIGNVSDELKVSVQVVRNVLRD